MIKVRLHFTLVGRTDEWKRSIPKGTKLDWSNTDTLDFVNDMVTDYFGNRARVIVNERLLKDDAVSYPKFYSAGWFFDEERGRELVVLNHGDTMAEANRSMVEYIKNVNWEESSVSVK